MAYHTDPSLLATLSSFSPTFFLANIYSSAQCVCECVELSNVICSLLWRWWKNKYFEKGEKPLVLLATALVMVINVPPNFGFVAVCLLLFLFLF